MRKHTPNQASHDRFDRLVVFVNPKSTNSAAVQKRIQEVRNTLHDLPFDTIEAKGDHWSANHKLIERNADKLGTRTLLCIAAGDGTTNYIIESLLTADIPAKARQTVLLPLWGGNANDLAHMLNGPAYRARLHDIVTGGNIVPVHPLECDMRSEKGKRTVRIAACYASFGATAFAAQKLNEDSRRQRITRLAALPGGRFLQELITVIGALIDAPTFSIKESDAAKVVYERTFTNGSRMAKIIRLPVQLTDESFYLYTMENKKWSSLPRLIESTSKRLSAKFLRNFAYFTVQENSWAQFDGEPVEIPAHTKVQVQLSRTPFYALSSVLTAEESKNHQ